MRASIRPVVVTLIAVGAVFAANAAHADVSSSPCGNGLDCSSGTAGLHAESRVPVMSSIGTGWIPQCDPPTADGHCSNQHVQVAISMDLAAFPDPSKEPLWMVDMPKGAVVNAQWPTDKQFEFMLPTSTTQDGTFKVSHSLIPSVRVHAQLLGFTVDWTYDASRYLQEVAPNFQYRATNTVSFPPWSMQQAIANVVPSPSLTTTTLIDTMLLNSADNQVALGLGAKTSPTFAYRTTKVTLANTTPITKDAPTGNLAMKDADALDLKADVEGEITVNGELTLAPYVNITRVYGVTVPAGLGLLDASSFFSTPSKTYEATPPVAVKFNSVNIHIPLPNVKGPLKGLDLGSVQVGDKAEQPVSIKNTGELGGKMAFTSSDPQFTVVASATVDPKTDYSLVVRFTPTSEGPAKSTITIKSNDPDSPVQTFEVRANGTPVPVEPAAPAKDEPETTAAPAADSGCGCHTAPIQSSYGAVAGLGLAAILVARRRRARA
ncbi:choice-of-anchor D domain-containing protein [Labilithrix luteola]|nr:choice-of-anchor D domain-containing protein [Labilithrix luteola]